MAECLFVARACISGVTEGKIEELTLNAPNKRKAPTVRENTSARVPCQLSSTVKNSNFAPVGQDLYTR
eukprot:6470810-Amphidinium_carterae.1